MLDPQPAAVGRVVTIRRHPVKSMLGEEIEAGELTPRGLLGDRAYALVDAESGRVASAKDPRRWPNLFDFHAAFIGPAGDDRAPGPVRITLPDGGTLATDDGAEVDARLSEAVGRPVRLARSALDGATSVGYVPDHDWLPGRDETFEFALPPGTFFDGAPVHLLTTATLDHLRKLTPGSLFEIPRFRPNLVIEAADGAGGFVEDGWIGRTLAIGAVRLRVEGPCPRCVMTTLAQGGLPKDPAILRTAVRDNGGNVGVYARVEQGGAVRRGDVVGLI